MKHFFTLLILMGVVAITNAQQTVSGNITDETGNPLSEVKVTVKGLDVGTVSNTYGQYVITIPEGYKVLSYSKESFQVQEVVVVNNVINIKMSSTIVDIFDLSLEELMQIEVKTATGRTEKISEAPANVIVLTQKDFTERGYTELSEIMNDLPGMDIIRPYGDFYIRNYWRGFRNIIGSPYLFMVDGIVTNSLYFNDPEGFTAMPISNIKQIEIVYGPASSVYGANAAMGVINIITKQDADNNGLSVNSTTTTGFGNNQWLSKIGDMNLFFKQNKFRMSFTGKFDFTNMNMEFVDDYEWTSNKYANDTLLWGDFLNNPNFGGDQLAPRKNYALDLRTYYGGTEFGIQYFKQHTSWGLTYPTDKYLNNAQWIEPELSIYLRHKEDLTENFTSSTLLQYRQSNLAPGSSSIANYGGASPMLYYEYWQLFNQAFILKEDFTFNFKQIGASTGFSYSHNDMSKKYDYVSGDGVLPEDVDLSTYDFPEIPSFYPKMNNRVLSDDAGLYANISLAMNDFTFMPKFIRKYQNNIILGTRFDYNSIYKWANTYRVGYVGIFNKLNIKLLYGEGFQAPPANMLYSDFEGRKSSSELKPEKSKTSEININYNRDRFLIGVSAYLIGVDNAIVQYEGKAQNAGKRNVLGTDIFTKFLIPTSIGKFDLWLYYSYIEGKEEKFDADNNLLKTDIGDLAPHKIKSGLVYSYKNHLNIGFFGRWISERKTVETNPIDKIDAYFVTDFNIAITNLAKNKLNFNFRVTNLLNQKYYHPGVADANAGTDAGRWINNEWSGSSGWYNSLLPQPGRMFYITMNIKI